MNSDDPYQAWLTTRRELSPPGNLTDRIMTAVSEVARQPVSPGRSAFRMRSLWMGAVPYLACSIAAMVLVARLYSTVSLLVETTPIADVAMQEMR